MGLKAPPIIACVQCGEEFERSPYAWNAKWCSHECELAALAHRRTQEAAQRPPHVPTLSKRIAYRAEPPVCLCNHNKVPSPFHCPSYLCSRWKPSSEVMCAKCVRRAWWSR